MLARFVLRLSVCLEDLARQLLPEILESARHVSDGAWLVGDAGCIPPRFELGCLSLRWQVRQSGTCLHNKYVYSRKFSPWFMEANPSLREPLITSNVRKKVSFDKMSGYGR